MLDWKRKSIDTFLGIHLGDALGVPFEMMTRTEILAATGGEGVTRPRFDLDPSTRKLADTRGLAPGSTSDDSQLSNATAEGLIMAGSYCHALQVLLHLKALWNDVAGWGGTTKVSLYEIDKWYRARRKGFGINPPPDIKKAKDQKLWSEAEPRDPRHRARVRANARGNGPSMKIAPLGLFYALRGGGDFETGEALEAVLEFSRMTHEDPVCAVAAYAVASTVCVSFTDGPRRAKELLMERVEAAERALSFIHHRDGYWFSTALTTALSFASDPEKLWAFGSAGKADSLTTVPMALGIWWRHAEDGEPTAAVLEAINAGGDTDTVASMVGAMMGAACVREDWWPADWVASLKDGGALARHLGARLHDIGTLRRPPDGFDLGEIKRALGY
ncbi:MAG TPA: ADP-ribosylglycohydrolase family protein [Patescibacteria group bacterium]|nr:ADP-ribosylglycohydrolase family protein [Patescibacteria group bacterium]